MKKVRLKVPLKLKDRQMYLRVVKNPSQAFFDLRCKKKCKSEKRNFVFDVELPDEIEIILVTPSSKELISQKIADNWMDLCEEGWGIDGLRKVLIFSDVGVFEVSAKNDKPDIHDWLSHKEDERWTIMKWAVVVHCTDENPPIGTLHWNADLLYPV